MELLIIACASLLTLAGIVGVFWLVAFFYFVHDEPDMHPRISEEELLYLQKSIVKTKHTIPVRITLG